MNKQQALALGGILLLGVGIIAYQSLPSVRNGEASQNQDSAVQTAWENLRNANSAHVVTSLDLKLPNTAAQAANQPVVDITIQTEGDGIWREQPAYSGTFAITTKGRGMQLFTDGEIRILPEATLFKLQNLPTLLNPSGNLLDKWTRVEGPLLRATNPEESNPVFTAIFSNWTQKDSDNSSVRYEKTFSEDEERQIESAFRSQSSGSEALHILSRLVKNFNIDSAEAWLDSENQELRQLKFHLTNSAKPDQHATLQFTFSQQGKEVNIDTPETESTVRPEIFTQLFGEPKESPTSTPTP